MRSGHFNKTQLKSNVALRVDKKLIINIFLKVRKKEGRKIRVPNIQVRVHVGIGSKLAQKHTLHLNKHR